MELQTIFSNLLEQGLFFAVFVVYLVYTTKRSTERELNYFKIIQSLIDKEVLNNG